MRSQSCVQGGPGFYNAARKEKKQALAVGSFVVGNQPGEVPASRVHQPHGYGNQAASVRTVAVS